mgnify:CR=1 FL=1
MDFEKALAEVKHNGRGMRLGKWSEEVAVWLQETDAGSKMTSPYLYVESRYGKVPWTPTQIEMLSSDWRVVEKKNTEIDLFDEEMKKIRDSRHCCFGPKGADANGK